MNYDNRPGQIDGPPRTDPGLPGRIIGSICVIIPIAFILVALVWGTVWMIVNFPT